MTPISSIRSTRITASVGTSSVAPGDGSSSRRYLAVVDGVVFQQRAGHFDASEGPKLLDVRFDGDDVVVASSPVVKVIVSGGGERYECRYGLDLTETRVPLTFFRNGAFEVDPALGSYLRITVVDARGKRAWTNPIWLS